jgi:hypothetical protein
LKIEETELWVHDLADSALTGATTLRTTTLSLTTPRITLSNHGAQHKGHLAYQLIYFYVDMLSVVRAKLDVFYCCAECGSAECRRGQKSWLPLTCRTFTWSGWTNRQTQPLAELPKCAQESERGGSVRKREGERERGRNVEEAPLTVALPTPLVLWQPPPSFLSSHLQCFSSGEGGEGKNLAQTKGKMDKRRLAE